MPQSPEEKQASAALGEALALVIRTSKIFPEDAIIVSWATSIEAIAPREGDGEDDLEYFGMAFPDGHIRTTVAIGLFTKGLEMLRTGELVNGDDDGEG